MTLSVKNWWDSCQMPFDVGTICHQHEAGMEPFEKHSRYRWALRPGSYKRADDHCSKGGFKIAKPFFPTVILWPGRFRITGFLTIEEAAEALNLYRMMAAEPRV